MKKIVSIAVASVFALTSCSDFLDENLKKELSPTNTYTSTHGFEVGVTGLYEYARSEWNTWGTKEDGNSFAHGSGCPYESLQIGTDIAVTGHNDGTLKVFDNLSYTPLTVFIKSFWNFGYGLISSSNLILAYSETNTNWDAPTDKIGFQAEARFFRAYGYRYLVYLYGDVPYVDKVQDKFRVDFTRTPKAEVLQKMIEDLEFAAKNLPEDPDKVMVGRLTSWAAKHLLSEVYLMAGQPDKAEKVAEEVINSGKFSLVKNRFGKQKDEPGDAFSDLFKENNQNRTAGNRESIWVMQLEYKVIGGGAESEDWTKRAWVPKYWDVKGDGGFVIADSLGGRGLAQLVPIAWWVNGETFYDKEDIRNSEYNIKRNWYYNDPNKPNYGKKVELTEAMWKEGLLCPAITKFFYGKIDSGEDSGYGGNTKDRMKFRLAETYLLLAEARLQQGNLSGAADAINEVRERAHANPITSAEVTVDFLLDERIREMVGEEIRRFTLSRLGKLKERTLKYNSHAVMEDKHLLWPIPQDVINSNTGAEFPQNPGWEQ